MAWGQAARAITLELTRVSKPRTSRFGGLEIGHELHVRPPVREENVSYVEGHDVVSPPHASLSMTRAT
jgi:hypothetical protein